MTVQIKGWSCKNGTYTKGRISIVKNGKVKAFVDGKMFVATQSFEKPGDFVEWMDKAEKFANLIMAEDEKCQKA